MAAISRLRVPPQTLLGGLLTVAVATLIVRGFSVGREVIVARDFGVGRSVDAFVVAYLIPSFAVAIVAGSANAALIPTYVRIRETRSARDADRLAGTILSVVIAALIVMAALLAIAMPTLLKVLAPGFDRSTGDLALRLSYVLLALIPLSGAASVFAAVLNSHRRFAFAALAPLASPCFAVVALLIGRGALGISALATGLVFGGLGELTLVIYASIRTGSSIRPRRLTLSPEMRTVMQQWAPVALGAAAMSTSPLIDQAMASTLGVGSVSALAYGSKLVTLVISVTALAVGTVFTPYLSKMLAENDFAAVRRTVIRYVWWIGCATVPVVVAVEVFSRPIVSLLFGRGAFSEADVTTVAEVQRLFAIQLPFYVAGMVLVRLIASLRANRLILWGSLINVAVNFGGNYVLMRILGVRGIALSTSIVFVVSFAYLVFAATHAFRRRRVEGGDIGAITAAV